MTIQQEAYSRIDQMTDEGLKILIDMIDKMRTVSVTGLIKKWLKASQALSSFFHFV